MRWVLCWEFEERLQDDDVPASLDQAAFLMLSVPEAINLDEADLRTWFLVQAQACLRHRLEQGRDGMTQDLDSPRAAPAPRVGKGRSSRPGDRHDDA